jgi:MSHA biogenesis protein MshG
MPYNFEYQARTREGEKRSGLIQAEDISRVAEILADQHLIPVNIKEKKKKTRAALFGFMTSRLYEELIIFTRNLSTLYKSGIPILRALSIIRIGKEDGIFNAAIAQIRENVRAGRPLSDSLKEYPRLFPKYYVAAVTAGESSGKLDEILDSLGVMLEKDLELNRQIKSSVRYPVTVVIAIALAFTALFTFVIPRFVQFYSKMGAQLPLPTRLLIGINEFITGYWPLVVGGVAIIVIGIRYFYTKPEGRIFFDSLFLKLPIFGDLITKGTTARFSNIFQILSKSGIPVVRCLELLSDIVTNSRISRDINSMGNLFRGGKELSNATEQLTTFPEMALHMIKVGLESGSLELMLGEIANHYGNEVNYKSRQITALLEPILTLVLAVFVLIVALAIFLPMWNLIQVFRG